MAHLLFADDDPLVRQYLVTVLERDGHKIDTAGDGEEAYRMLRERGGGALLDIGIHMADLLRWWFGDVQAVCGGLYTAVRERPKPDGSRGTVTADDTASFLARLPSDVVGSVQVSQAAHGRPPQCSAPSERSDSPFGED